MPTVDELFPSKWLKADDLRGEDVRLTIQSVDVEEVGKERERKAVAQFKGTDKALALNKTNFIAIADLHGDNSDDWGGKPIILYPDRVPFGGKMHDVVRIRPFTDPEDKAAPSSPDDGPSPDIGDDFEHEIPF